MRKDTKNKPKLKLLKRSALEAIAGVREYGIAKYKNDYDWADCSPDDYVDAALRHLYKWLDGEDLDRESGLCHLAHAMTSLMLAHELLGREEAVQKTDILSFLRDKPDVVTNILHKNVEWESGDYTGISS